MPALNGYGTLTEGDSSTSAVDTAAETFVTAGLSKVLKINNICDNDHLADCGIVSELTPLGTGDRMEWPKTIGELNSAFISALDGRPGYLSEPYNALDTKAAAFETANGESIAVYYNPNCTPDMDETREFYVQPKICAHFIYDLNGSKGPNTVNKDIGFITAIYPTDSSVVSPYVHTQDASDCVAYEDVARACTEQDSQYRMPNRYELISMFASRDLMNLAVNGYNTSSLLQINGSKFAWRLNIGSGNMTPQERTNQYYLRCVKRD